MDALLAQAIDPAGVAGWTSFGLAGIVLYWVLMHNLPAQRRELKEYVDMKEGQILELARLKSDTIAKLTTEFRAAQEKAAEGYRLAESVFTAHCQKEISIIADRFGIEMDRQRKSSDDSRKEFMAELREFRTIIAGRENNDGRTTA